MRKSFFGFLLLAFISHPGLAQFPYWDIDVDLSNIKNPDTKKLLGMSFDGRSSVDADPSAAVDPIGYFDPATGVLIPALQPLWNRMPMGGARYPGNLCVFNWNWSYTIGPVSGRISQPMGPNGTSSQVIQFGFDEFMAMALSKGIPSAEVQIMVNIYPSVGQANPAILAADWVEYCNAPNNGSNPRGGTDWAALRDSFGHPAPYGIRIWNIGNEPWGPTEFGNSTAGADAYMAVASPIIDSMLAADPSIQISIPSVGNANSPWNAQILNSNASTPLLGRMYGLSSHAFYDIDLTTNNPSPQQAITLVTGLAATLQSMGLKLLEGDHASFAPSLDQDKAMRWEGALATATYLVGISQISNVELANFWIYGNTRAEWHPIRKNGPGSYTLMAAAKLYETLFPHFQGHSLSTSIQDSTGWISPFPITPTVSAFRSADSAQLSIVIADIIVTSPLIVPVIPGYTLMDVELLNAPNLTDDTFLIAHPPVLGNWHIYMFPNEIYILSYSQNATTNSTAPLDDLRLFPNPSKGVFNFRCSAQIDHVVVHDILGQVIGNFVKPQAQLDLSGYTPGTYLLKFEDVEGHVATKRVVVR